MSRVNLSCLARPATYKSATCRCLYSYEQATTLGAILELRAGEGQNALSAERAAQSVEYWRATAETLGTATQDRESQDYRKAYAKMAAAQAGLLNQQGYQEPALEAFAIAIRISPGSPEAVFGYVNLLVGQNRIQDAIPVVEAAVAADAGQGGFVGLLNQLRTMPQTAPARTP